MEKNKIILITGTSRGIGQALAEFYLKKGYMVIGCSRKNPEWTDQKKEAKYLHYELDIADEDAVKRMFSEIRKQFGTIDYLINNAGIAAMNHSLLMPAKTVVKIFNTNFLGTFIFCREAAKLMQKNKFGRIVNFSTVAVPLRLDGEAVYAASKAAVVSLTQILAKEFSQYSITVNAVGPTPIKTDLIKAVPQEKIDRLLKKQAIERYGRYEDIINIVEFFLKKESDFITGQVIYLGGV